MNNIPPTESKREFTVEDAIADYKAGVERTKGYRDLVDILINVGFAQPFDNDSYADALMLTEKMLTHSHNDIRILTGGACGGFYAVLIDHLTKALRRIQKNRGKAKMIVCAQQCPRWLQVLSREFADTFSIALIQPAQGQKHFIVCDSKIVRQEQAHAELTRSSSAYEIKAQVNFGNPVVGAELEQTFDALWDSSQATKVFDSVNTTAPSWLVQRMDAVRHLPSPTSEKALEQWSALGEARRKSDSKQIA